jgi:hypothetical protein
VDSASATDHLFVDFERVVSYDSAVSDESKAEELYGAKQTAADLPAPAASATGEAGPSPSPSGSATTPGDDNTGAGGDNGDASGDPGAPSASASQTPAELQPRVLDGLGDQAFIDDKLSTGSSTGRQRTVTVVFRTSNVIVTIEYAEQPTASAEAPDSKEMQDRAWKLARKLADKLNG